MDFRTDKLLHGGDYNPEQWLKRPDILEKDIDMLEESGCNVVSLGIFSWSTLEPEEGVFHFEWLQEIIDKLYKRGISTILATPSGARPKWMADKYPEVLRVDETRRRALFGFRHNHCYTSPVYREKVHIINKKLAQEVATHPGVILWHISNEYGGECHCPLCQKAFRNWLKEKYQTIENLNDKWCTTFWSHTYNSFDQIESPSKIGETQLHALNLDWKRFVTHQTADFIHHEIAALREGGSTLPTTANLMYYFGGLDYFKIAKEIDVVSWDTYPTWHKVEINVCVGCNLTHYHNVSCCSTGFASYAAHRILLKQRIQNRIRNGITDFVRMSFGYRLRSKQSFFHSFSPFFLLFSFAFRSWALAFPEHFFVKKDPQFLADLNSNVQIPLLFENFAQAGTFPYRPFCLGVAVVSQILCISTTLNKRKATEFLILFFATLIHYRKIRHSSRGNKRI